MSVSLAARLEDLWYGRRAGGWLLAPLAFLFALGAALRRRAYRHGWRRTYRVRVPVVVVGNLTVGGTGKSPLVAALATTLRRRGFRPGILTRGYGVSLKTPRNVTVDSDPAQVGDEARMLARDTGLPVVASVDRVAGAEALVARGVDVIVCDDGLQHYALHRDVEIVVIDAVRGLGNGRLLPAGPLREGSARLASVDAVVLHGAQSAQAAEASPWRGRDGVWLMQLVPEAARNLCEPRRWCALEQFRGQRVHAVAGIGHPARFFAVLRAAGLEVIEHPFPDHHAFVATDLDFGDSLPVLMTAKDAVKCRSFAQASWFELPVIAQLQPDGGESLVDRIVARLNNATGRP